MQHKKLQRHSHGLPLEPSEVALEHLNMWSLVGSRDTDLLQVAEWIYKGKYMVVPSMFTHAQCNECMKELQRELSRHLTQAGLQSERGPAELPSRSCS